MMRRIARPEVGVCRVVAELLILDQVPDNINAKAIDTTPKPKPHSFVNRLADLRIAPVKVGLGLEESVIVELPDARIIFPCTPPKLRKPVVGRPTVWRRVSPDIPVVFGVMP